MSQVEETEPRHPVTPWAPGGIEKGMVEEEC